MGVGKKEFAYAEIKRRIIEGELEQLQDISEDKLKDELNTSRMPVHEAITRLAAEGFVYIYSRKGTFVSAITTELMEEIFEMRTIAEPALARRACKVMTDEKLYEMLNRFKNPPENMNYNEYRIYYTNLDQELHRTVMECSSNRFLKNTLGNVYDHLHRYRLKVSYYKEEFDRSIIEHSNIIEAILERDEDLAAEKTMEHLKIAKINAHKFSFLR